MSNTQSEIICLVTSTLSGPGGQDVLLFVQQCGVHIALFV